VEYRSKCCVDLHRRGEVSKWCGRPDCSVHRFVSLFMAHNAEEEASETRIFISALHTRKSLALRKSCVVVLLISFSSLSLCLCLSEHVFEFQIRSLFGVLHWYALMDHLQESVQKQLLSEFTLGLLLSY
jgi:hypothetical protein